MVFSTLKALYTFASKVTVKVVFPALEIQNLQKLKIVIKIFIATSFLRCLPVLLWEYSFPLNTERDNDDSKLLSTNFVKFGSLFTRF